MKQYGVSVYVCVFVRACQKSLTNTIVWKDTIENHCQRERLQNVKVQTL